MRALGETRDREQERGSGGGVDGTLVDLEPIRIVAAGGGTGLPAVLAGLVGTRARSGVAVEVTGLVTTADDGGSSGVLRREFGIPAPGDARNCLVALAPAPSPLAELFQHRFGDGALAGHALGNLMLAALAQRLGSFEAAVETAAQLLGVRGRVLPAAGSSVDLVATLEDGRVIRGESAISAARGRVQRLSLEGMATASCAAVEAISAADLVVLGPGSLYSSVIASLLADGTAAALRACRGLRVLLVNVFTERGETDGYDATDHVHAIQRHVGKVVDLAVVHRVAPPADMIARYAAEGAAPVGHDRRALAEIDVGMLATDVLASGPKARHDPSKIGPLLVALALRRASSGDRCRCLAALSRDDPDRSPIASGSGWRGGDSLSRTAGLSLVERGRDDQERAPWRTT